MTKSHINISGGGIAQFIANLLLYDVDAYAYGSIKFVDSTSANASDTAGFGFSPEAPFKTINFGVTQLVADNNDVLIVCPGHAEVIAAAGGITVDRGCSIRGIGQGRKRPKISFSTAASASFLITGSNVTIDNLYFDCTGFAAVVAPINLQGADVTIQNCEFLTDSVTNQCVQAIKADGTTLAADRLKLFGNHFHGVNAGVTAAITIVGGSDVRIEDNLFQGSYSAGVGAINNITTAMVNAIVRRNKINNLTASSTAAMAFVAASTGMISDNHMQILSATAPIIGAAMSWVGNNYYSATIAHAGTLI